MCFYFMAWCSFKKLETFQPEFSSVIKPYDKFSTIIKLAILSADELQDRDENDMGASLLSLQDLLTNVALNTFYLDLRFERSLWIEFSNRLHKHGFSKKRSSELLLAPGLTWNFHNEITPCLPCDV